VRHQIPRFHPPEANHPAADHPHGGGRGKSKGNVNPVSPWGMPVSWNNLSPICRFTNSDVGQRWIQDSPCQETKQVGCDTPREEPWKAENEVRSLRFAHCNLRNSRSSGRLLWSTRRILDIPCIKIKDSLALYSLVL
jgi:hypothetical protein